MNHVGSAQNPLTLAGQPPPGVPTERLQLSLRQLKDGDLVMPSATRRADGKPRFVMPLQKSAMENDLAVAYMVRHEVLHDGFERPTRDLIDAHLEPGDLFVDVGAHYGMMSFSAVTSHPGKVHAIAIEAHPENAARVFKGVKLNGFEPYVETVAAAAGARLELASLAFNTTMGHSLLATQGRVKEGTLYVPVLPLDDILDGRPDLAGRPIVLKIDVEGLEPEVIAGCRRTIASGRVKLIVWERGFDYRDAERRKPYADLFEELQAVGFSHWVFPWFEWGGILIPDHGHTSPCNVYSFARDARPRAAYPLRFDKLPPYNLMLRISREGDATEFFARACIARNASDGERWADPEALALGAEDRARDVAAHVRPGESVLDAGCGLMALKKALPEGCAYAPADLLARGPDTLLVDFNQGQFPDGRWDVVALVEVLEYVHELPRVLRRARDGAKRLLLSYRTLPAEAVSAKERRKIGMFNDFTAEGIEALLGRCGWKISTRATAGGAPLWVCE